MGKIKKIVWGLLIIMPVGLMLRTAHAAALNVPTKALSPPPPQDVLGHKLSLSAQASADVLQDTVRIVLLAEQQGNDPASLTAMLKQKVARALRIAQSQKTVSAQTGLFRVYPRTGKSGRTHGWQGRAELILDASDVAATARLAGQLSPMMHIDDVRFSLSPKAIRALQTRLVKEAVGNFREQAQTASRAFGYHGYSVTEVHIRQNRAGLSQPIIMAAGLSAGEEEPDLPLAAGKSTVTVMVSGEVRMTP